MSKETVLIVDKDKEALEIFSSRLELRGYKVLCADDSELAVRMVLEEVPDIVFLDARMDAIKGEDLPNVIKNTTHNFFIPIVMMADRDNIASQIMGMQWGYDDFILKPFTPIELQVRLSMNLKRVYESVQANPLTKLPGNIAIERKIKECIESGEKFSICYIDIDNFKSFNDKYGFDKGDDAIVQVSRIILRCVQGIPGSDIFVGHVGGDDFVLVMHPDQEEMFADRCIEEFDRLMPTHYTKEDQQAREIVVKNRRGVVETFPLMSISVSAVTNLYRDFSNPGEIAQTAAEVKKFLKQQDGSNYLRDRREQQVAEIEEVDRVFHIGKEKRDTSEPLGQVLLNAGLITEEQLQQALRKHFTGGQRLGRILIQMKAVSREKVGQMLEKKLGVPYISLKGIKRSPKVQRLFTVRYMRTYGVVPVSLNDNCLKVAMIDPFALNTIDDIERITEYKVHPCICLEEEIMEFFDGLEEPEEDL